MLGRSVETDVDAKPHSLSLLTAALAEAEARFRTFSESSLHGKMVVRAYRPLWANAVAARTLGIASPEALCARLSMLSFLDEATQQDPDRTERDAMLGVQQGRSQWRRADGTPITVSYVSRPLRWSGQPALLLAFHDITDLERARAEADLAIAQAHSEKRSRRRLMSSISHHLRTPQHAVMGRLLLSLRESLDPDARRLIQGALQECRRVLFQIDDILDAAALESGAPHLRMEAFDLADAIDDALQANVGMRPERSNLRIDAPLPGAVQVQGDKRRLSRIVLAILEEAERRAAGREVSLMARADGGRVLVHAHAPNTLSGLEPPDPDILVGLPLATAMVGAMGGTVRLEAPAPGTWSATVQLPFPALENNPIGRRTVTRALQILAIDDHPGNLHLMEIVIQALGHEATLAASGPQGIEALASAPFDLVLMDLMMPEVDGFETAQRIRRSGQAWASIPIVAVTADATPEAHADAEEAGMDAVLTKPLDLHRMIETIAYLCGDNDLSSLVEAAGVNQLKQQNRHEKQSDHSERNHRRISQTDRCA